MSVGQVVERVRTFFDKDSEPLRRKVYSTLLSALTLAVLFGVVSGEEAASLAGIVASLLLVPATEIARTQVTPLRPAKHREPKS